MLIHFPSALLPMDLACSVLGYYTSDPAFTVAAFFSMAGAVLLGTLAVITGTWDLLAVAQEKPLALQKAVVHGGINTAVIIVYSFLALRAYANYPNLVDDTMALLVIKACLVTFMFAGNYIGGSLILKYRVGLRNDQGPS